MTGKRLNLSILQAVGAVGAMLGCAIGAASAAQAQGPDDFLNDINNVGLGDRNDTHNFDLVGLGNVICWRLYGGEAPGAIADMVVSGSGSDGHSKLTNAQATAVVSFAVTDLCPDAAPKPTPQSEH
jgi:hypothetical protein